MDEISSYANFSAHFFGFSVRNLLQRVRLILFLLILCSSHFDEKETKVILSSSLQVWLYWINLPPSSMFA